MLSCAKEHRSLPKQGFTCCLAMDGIKVLASGFDMDEKVSIVLIDGDYTRIIVNCFFRSAVIDSIYVHFQTGLVTSTLFSSLFFLFKG